MFNSVLIVFSWKTTACEGFGNSNSQVGWDFAYWVALLDWVVFGFFAWELGLEIGVFYVAWACLGTAWEAQVPN